MLTLGYVVSRIKYRDMPDGIIQTVPGVEDCVYDVPKLIVGLSEAKEYAKRNNLCFDILEHSYPNGDRWTFGKTEKRDMYETDLSSFKNYVVKKASEMVEYRYVNLLTLRYSQLKKVLQFVLSNPEEKYYFIDYDGMVYVSAKDGVVAGFSLKLIEYVKISREKVISLLRRNPSNHICFASSKKIAELRNLFKDRSYVIASFVGQYLS